MRTAVCRSKSLPLIDPLCVCVCEGNLSPILPALAQEHIKIGGPSRHNPRLETREAKRLQALRRGSGASRLLTADPSRFICNTSRICV